MNVNRQEYIQKSNNNSSIKQIIRHLEYDDFRKTTLSTANNNNNILFKLISSINNIASCQIRFNFYLISLFFIIFLLPNSISCFLKRKFGYFSK